MYETSSLLRHFAKVGLLAAAATLAACNDEDTARESDTDHEHVESSAGRLVFGKADGANSKVIVHDLGARKTAGEFALANEPTAVYSSPELRYALVLQGTAGHVNFVDGGIYQHEDHVDTDTPSLLGFQRSGVKPAHWQTHEGLGALFYDGAGADAARFDLLSDASLEKGAVEASYVLPAPVHGVAEPRGDYLIALDYTAEEHAAAATRTAVRLYERRSGSFVAGKRFDTPCLNLHGAGGNEDYVAFGCTDGVMLIEQNGSMFTDSKIATAERITQIAGHHAAARFAAFAADGSLYVIDPVAKTATASDWSNGAVDAAGVPVTRLQHAFDATAENLLILDNTGTLHVLKASNFARRGGIKVLETVATGTVGPRIAVSSAEDHAFINDANGKAIVVIDLATLAIVDHVDLGFAPVGVTWVGVGADDHAH